MSNQDTITQPDSKKSYNWNWAKIAWDWSVGMSKTAIALIFIVNGVAISLFALDLVHPSREAAGVMGAITAAFVAVVLFILVNGGVKNLSTTKRKK